LSLGGTVQGPHDMLAEAINAAVDAGVVAAVAGGNAGPGWMTIESPGSAANAITAGATTNSHFLGVAVNVTSGSGTVTYGGAVGSFDPFAATPATGQELADWAVTGDPVTACVPATSPAPIAGKIALIRRGTCTFTTKIRNAQNAGAFGVIIYNNVNGAPIAMGPDGTTPIPTIPAVMVSNVDGAAILASLPAAATIDGTVLSELSGPPDYIASFSGRGPAPFTYIIKPDLTGPGVDIYSSVLGGWEMYQGTSMATPHVTGSAALLLQLHPGWTPADVKSALVNNGARVVVDGNGNDPGVLARGGGRLALVPASATPLTFYPSNASFGFWNGNVYVRDELDVAVKNVSGLEQSCTVAVTGDPIVAAEPGSFVVLPGESATLQVLLDGGKSNQTPTGDYSGDVVVTCSGVELRLPWYTHVDREAKP
jgi:minor extracellular serine protease Vpr